MNNEEWIGENVKAREDGSVGITCGHDSALYEGHFIGLRDENPSIYYLCCVSCYHRLLGVSVDDIRTLKTK